MQGKAFTQALLATAGARGGPTPARSDWTQPRHFLPAPQVNDTAFRAFFGGHSKYRRSRYPAKCGTYWHALHKPPHILGLFLGCFSLRLFKVWNPCQTLLHKALLVRLRAGCKNGETLISLRARVGQNILSASTRFSTAYVQGRHHNYTEKFRFADLRIFSPGGHGCWYAMVSGAA